MNKPIQTYEELLSRKKDLERLLEAQKELIIADVEELKTEFNPVFNAASKVTQFFSRDKKSWFLGIGANTLIDFFVKDVLLSKAGWITKLIVPFFIKNYSSHFIADHQDEWMQNIAEWLSHKNGHDKEKAEEEAGLY